MKKQSGFSFEGEFKDGKFSGRGTATYPSGEIFTGQYVEGFRSGEGTLKYSNG